MSEAIVGITKQISSLDKPFKKKNASNQNKPFKKNGLWSKNLSNK